MSSKLTGIRFTLIDLRLTQVSSVTWTTLAREAVLSINAHTAMTGIRLTVIDVDLAGRSRVTRRAFALIPGYSVPTNTIVLTRLRQTIVDIDLTP